MSTVFVLLATSWIILILLLELLFLISLFVPEKITYTEIQPTVSIIVAVWKEGERIEKCLRSLLKQDYPKTKTEIIVIGGGENETVTICQKFANEGKIKFIHEKTRQGKWWALNKGIEGTKNETIGFTDADCVLPPNWLKNLVSRLNDGDIIISPYIYNSERTWVHKTTFISTFVMSSIMRSLSKIFRLSPFFGFGCLMKRKVIEKIKFKKSYIEDIIFSYDANKIGFKIIFDSRVRPRQANPNTLSDVEKFIRRATPAVLDEMSKMADLTSYFVRIFGILSFFSLPFWLFCLFIGNNLAIFMGLVFVVVSMMVFLLILVSEGFISKLHYFPLLLLSIFIYGFFGIKEAVVFKFHKNKNWDDIWPIYNKA